MNEKFHNSIKKAGEEISLTNAERVQMRRTLHSYMEMKPLRTSASAPVMTFGWLFTMRPVAAVLVLAVFVSSAGVSYASENALPGDVLYPIKIRVNEPVKGALAVSASAKTAWAMDVAGERVKEAATLAAEGRLNTKTQDELQVDFERHARQATVAMEENASSSPEVSGEAAVRFEAQLTEYENVLAQIGAAKDVDVVVLTSSVKSERERVAAVRARAESRIASTGKDQAAAERMGIAARAHLDTSVRLARAVSKSLSASSAELVAAQLEDASSTISAGETFAEREAIPDARGAFRKAISATEKLGVFLQTSSDIHARTGLVVGEPRKSKPGKKNEGRDDSQAVRAAATMNVSATSSTTTPPVETDTNVDVRKRGGDEQGIQQETEDRDEKTLPVSVPVHLGL
ncbi:hypothetical protein A3D71_02740 [Candidatus Kaiserbacteria bacterium RIFCSPHIGHO2_02_FULL_55_20]|uniref:DUF5667 domain-containing protein n=1 Tax=Candidatus Kaiserbacteria bacterium RIFCSPHIGHO2_02_FULL_55_20 TaxID=1798497 RepID=A0A1F6DYQ5_9BACT|nr:MAG: hypothetical protein A2680_00080 [Candidatus Kaiserbacteria bacterium RIFCSPHIGHO2_01_FULL_55_37]OGG66551.1 MAG: hypothetical protein A3D71_02740 [Candidatus Kaiserbacteria bacterium RIFCSPHIGHO2_02_FULL_55_20]